jgi:hypothetical protein
MSCRNHIVRSIASLGKVILTLSYPANEAVVTICLRECLVLILEVQHDPYIH